MERTNIEHKFHLVHRKHAEQGKIGRNEGFQLT